MGSKKRIKGVDKQWHSLSTCMGLSFLSQSVQSAKLEMVGIRSPHPHPVHSTDVSAFPVLQGGIPTAAIKISLLSHCVPVPAVLKDTWVLGLEAGMPKSKIWLGRMT